MLLMLVNIIWLPSQKFLTIHFQLGTVEQDPSGRTPIIEWIHLNTLTFGFLIVLFFSFPNLSDKNSEYIFYIFLLFILAARSTLDYVFAWKPVYKDTSTK